MGKASELDRQTRRITQEDDDRRRGILRPSLRLRREVLARAFDVEARVQDVLTRLEDGDEDAVALHDPATGRTAVAISVERYSQLVASEIHERGYFYVDSGQALPPAGRLEAASVEQVDPQASWKTTGSPYHH